MIYYKKKNLFKKIFNLTSKKTQGFKPRVFLFSKWHAIIGIFLLTFFYLTYLFLTPKIVNDENAEKIINNYILKNSKLTLDIPNLSVYPDYRFNIKIKADLINLKYPNEKTFISLKNPDIDINLLSLLTHHIDINKIKTSEVEINTNFTKNNTYEFFKYIDTTKKNNTSKKFKLRNINLDCDKFSFNLFDENIKKMFYVKSNDLKISSSEFIKPILVSSSGVISSSNHKISDFNLKLSIKLNSNSAGKFVENLLKLNYNPFRYADKYSFYSKSDIDLKINPQDKKSNIAGSINLKDYVFSFENIAMPKNDLLLIFKDNKIYFNSDFKFIKNQHIKVKSTIGIANYKYFEAMLSSSKINLSDFNDVFAILCEILNFKFNTKEVLVSGNADIDLYIKSNFKTIVSKGKLLIQDGQINHKKLGLNLQNINSNIDFNNNTISIHDTSAFLNDSKFNLKGIIDNQTNLNLNITSDKLDIAQVQRLLKSIPFINLNNLKEYKFTKGFLTINSTVKGKLSTPLIGTNSTFDNLEISSIANNFKANIEQIILSSNIENNKTNNIFTTIHNTDFKYDNKKGSIKKISLNILENNINLLPTRLIFENIPLDIEGQIKNYKNGEPETNLNITSTLPRNYNDFTLQNKNPILKAIVNLKSNKISLLNCNLYSDNIILANVLGGINIKDEIFLENIKININNNLDILLPKFYSSNFKTKGNLVLNGKIINPSVTGKLFVENLNSAQINMQINSAFIDLKNSNFIFDVKNGRMFDIDFNLISKGLISNKGLEIDSINFDSMYVDLNAFEKYKNQLSNKKEFNYNINNIVGDILTVEYDEIILNALHFEGNIQKDILKISKFSSDLFNGNINGEIQYNFSNKKTDANIFLKEINIRLLTNKLKEYLIAASGKLSGNIKANFVLNDFKNILDTLEADIKFNIENGELSQFAKLERFLQAGNILSQSFLKLTLNSTLSALTKQNTGDFKSIEGKLKIKNAYANVEQITTQGSNMSLYLSGYFNLLNQYADVKILGRIPVSMVKVMGNIGDFSIDKQTNQTTAIEKRFSTILPQEDLEKIPALAYQIDNTPTREFIVLIDGISKNINSITSFKWHQK